MMALGVDPGLANFGWALAEVTHDAIEPLCVGVIFTEKSKKRAKVLAPDDEFRRSKELFAELSGIVRRNDVKLICAEGMSSPRNAVTVRMLGFAWGVLASLCSDLGVPLVQTSPNRLKKALCGRVSVTDVQLHARVIELYPKMELLVQSITQKTKREHAFDAMAAIEACRHAEPFVMLQGMS